MPVLGSSGPKGVTQKVELFIEVTSSSVVILAIDNLCLIGMKFQPTLS
jgi:hypothetical protein